MAKSKKPPAIVRNIRETEWSVKLVLEKNQHNLQVKVPQFVKNIALWS